jgi:hypothetical protein
VTMLASGLVACVVLGVNHTFTTWWVGSERYGGTWLTVALITAMMARHWNVTLTYSMFCSGYERRMAITSILEGAVSIGCMSVLMPRLGTVGAPLSTLISLCAVSLPSNTFALARKHEARVSSFILPLLPWFARFALLAGAVVMQGKLWFGGVYVMASQALLIGIAYGAAMFPLLWREPLRSYVTPKWQALRPTFAAR